MLFCQLIISALTRQKDLLDFGKVFIEFIPSSETPVSTRSISQKYEENKVFLLLSVSCDGKYSLSNCLNYISGSRRLRPPNTAFSIFEKY